MPAPPQFGGKPVTNIRNVGSPHWRRWLGQSSRCIVPATSFCEYADTKPRKTPKWFGQRGRDAVQRRRDCDLVGVLCVQRRLEPDLNQKRRAESL
jgi:hypothetical protein